MSTLETVEYYDTCPNCGATHDGSGTCSYCGTSMVKSRNVAQLDEDLESMIAREDAGLPVTKAKSGEVTPFLKMFCPLFGGIFIAVPTFLLVIFVGVGLMEPWLIGFFCIFYVIGIVGLAPLVVASRRKGACLKGVRVTGKVRGYSNSNTYINDEATKTIRVRLDGENPRIIELNTGEVKRRFQVGDAIALRTSGDAYLIEGPVK